MSDGKNSIADDILRNGFERWQRLEGEKQAISDDLKELFAELKSQGFDGKALRASFRVVAKAGDMAVEEHNALVDLYVGSLLGPAATEVGTVPATRTRAAREAEAEDRVDALAALRADPAMAIVDVANLKKPEPQLTKAAGSDLASAPQGQVAPIPEAKASTDGGATEQDIELPAESVTGEASRLAAGRTADAAGAEIPASNAGQQGSEQPESVTGGESAAPKYASPGVVTWETFPPEGVERSAVSTAFANMGQDPVLIRHDLEKGTSQPIVKMGKVILDGWARFMVARDMVELNGQPMSYAVVQYDGNDPLIDAIRWNVEGRTLDDHQKKLIAANLTRQNPSRKDDIYRAFEIYLEPV